MTSFKLLGSVVYMAICEYGNYKIKRSREPEIDNCIVTIMLSLFLKKIKIKI